MAFFEFPHTRTYDSDLAWLIRAYKILTGKVNNIEQTIEDTINDALQGEELKQLITQMIAEALPLNVKYPPAESGLTPAVGDGETDDTAALQAMIAYANAHNMPMIFPAGVYRVAGLNVNVDTVFQGFDATLMLAPVSAKPLITLTADLASSGLTLNGNLGGQTTAQNVINIANGSFAITNTTIMGGKSCIEGTLVGDSIIGDSYLRNFQEYGIHAEGSGNFTASNVVVHSVASGGAMRFMRIDCNNCTVSNFSSQAVVPIGFEITGNNNTITATIPKVVTPVHDTGEGNSWTITGNEEKLYFKGSATYNYQNLKENIAGTYTQSTGDFNGTATGNYSINGNNVILNPTNPLTYKTPSRLNEFFDNIVFKDANGVKYNVLVQNEGTLDLSTMHNVANILDYGAVGDGKTLCDSAFSAAIETGMPVFVPSGRFLISNTITLGSFTHLFGVGNNNLTSNMNSIIVCNNASVPVITMEYGSQFNSVKNVTVTHSVTATSGGDGVVAQGISNSIIQNVWSINNYNGFKLGNTGISWFSDCVAMNNDAVGVLYTNLEFSGALQWQTQRVFSSLNQSHGFSIVGVANSANHVTLGAFTQLYTYNNGGRGFYMLGTENAGINGFRIENSFFGNDIGGGIEINAAGTFGGFISDTVLEAAGLSAEEGFENNASAFGIYLIEGSGPITVSNCLIHTSASAGIQNRNQMTTVTGCQIIGNGYLQTNKIGINQVLGTMIINGCYLASQDYAGIIITNTENQIITSNMMKDTTTPYRALAGTENIVFVNNTNVS